ncbi:MAG: NAD(P)H-dependent flavin oxidoreductase [Burkholderiaceae bacterium]
MTVASIERAIGFAERFGLKVPVMMAPMAGACPVTLAAGVADGGGMGALGALLHKADAIADWVKEYRLTGDRPLQINLWVPDPEPTRRAEHEEAVAAFLAQYGPRIDPNELSVGVVDFEEQCEALLAAAPTAVSSIMGLYPEPFVARLKDAGIAWFACCTTVEEARMAAHAGADVIVAQGAEAGGHRGAFEAVDADKRAVGLFALVPQIADAVRVPVVATGGVADARGIAAALTLGASAVQIGTGLLRCPEAGISPAWAQSLGHAAPEKTRLTRAFSGRWGRALQTEYVIAAERGPEPAPYPVQRAMTAQMRAEATREDDIERMQAWAGQAAALASAEPAALLIARLWREAVTY